MPKSEKFLDSNNHPLNLVAFITADVQVGRKTIKNARIVITRDGKRTVNRRLASPTEL